MRGGVSGAESTGVVGCGEYGVKGKGSKGIAYPCRLSNFMWQLSSETFLDKSCEINVPRYITYHHTSYEESVLERCVGGVCWKNGIERMCWKGVFIGYVEKVILRVY